MPVSGEQRTHAPYNAAERLISRVVYSPKAWDKSGITANLVFAFRSLYAAVL
jgi:hypothetical protein